MLIKINVMEDFINIIHKQYFSHIKISHLINKWKKHNKCDIMFQGNKCNMECTKETVYQYCLLHQEPICLYQYISGKNKGQLCRNKTTERGLMCDKHKSRCTILIQSGPRMGVECQKKCISMTTTCKTHYGITMCSEPNCKKISIPNNKICSFHEKEQQYNQSLRKPKMYIRKYNDYYCIKDTNIAIDIGKCMILGYVDNNNLYPFNDKELTFYSTKYIFPI